MAKCNYSIYKRVICSKYVGLYELKNISFIVTGYKKNNKDYFKCETMWNCKICNALFVMLSIDKLYKTIPFAINCTPMTVFVKFYKKDFKCEILNMWRHFWT